MDDNLQKMNKISAVVITKNEANNIKRCLDSLIWVDEIVIVDDYSTDGTVEICKNYTEKIFYNKFEDFSTQKQFGISKTTNDWVLIVDADEVISKELRDEIIELFSSETLTNYYGFFIPRHTFYLGKIINYCGWKVKVLRLINKNFGKYNGKKVHEKIVIPNLNKVGYLKNPILHYSYQSITQHIEKINLYSSLDALELYSKGVRINCFNFVYYLFLKPIMIFIKKYFFMKGFLDGYRGFLISLFTSIVTILNYVKLKEIQDEKKESLPSC